MDSILETERLQLHPITLDDRDFVYEIMNCPKWIQHIGDRNIKSIQDAVNYIQNSFISSYERHGYGLYKITFKEDRIPLGICGFVKREALDSADLGFALLPQFERRGITYEASIGCLKAGFSQFNFEKVYAVISPENIASISLIEKLNFSLQSSDFQIKEEKLLLYKLQRPN